MIFVSVGTTGRQFNRLVKIIDECMLFNKSKEELIVQIGACDYQIRYKKSKVLKEMAFDKMIGNLKMARVVVCHGGPATIFLALRYSSCKPIVFPRLKQYGEHVNDHQKFFVSKMAKQDLVKLCLKNCSVKQLFKYLSKPELIKVKKGESKSKKNLIYMLDKYCSEK